MSKHIVQGNFEGMATGHLGPGQVLSGFLNEQANLRQRCVFALKAYNENHELEINLKTNARRGASKDEFVSSPLVGIKDLFAGSATKCHFLRDDPTLDARARLEAINNNNIHALLCIMAAMRKSLYTVFPPVSRMISAPSYRALLSIDKSGRQLPGDVGLTILVGPKLKLRFHYSCNARGKQTFRFKLFYEDCDREFILRTSNRRDAAFGYALERVSHGASSTASNPPSGVLGRPPFDGFTIDGSLQVMRQLNAMLFHSCSVVGGRQDGKMKISYQPYRRYEANPVVKEFTTLSCFKTEIEDSAHVSTHRSISRNFRNYGPVLLQQDWFADPK